MPTDNDIHTTYADGAQAVSDISVHCLNNAKDYITFDADPSLGATTKQFTDGNAAPIGSWTGVGFRTGTINMQYTLASDELAGSDNEIKPGFILLFRGRYYVAGAPKNKIVQNEVIKFSVPVTQAVNPIISGALSTLGQRKNATATANAAYTLSCAAVNSRTGATLAYAVSSYPSGSAPAGVTINASTGSLSATVAAGTYDVMVTCTDTVSGSRDNVGWGRVVITAS